jgi:hypothetical protein
MIQTHDEKHKTKCSAPLFDTSVEKQHCLLEYEHIGARALSAGNLANCLTFDPLVNYLKAQLACQHILLEEGCNRPISIDGRG